MMYLGRKEMMPLNTLLMLKIESTWLSYFMFCSFVTIEFQVLSPGRA